MRVECLAASLATVKSRRNRKSRTGISRGRWAVERERCHLDSEGPLAPLEEGHAISESLGLLVDKLGLDHRGWAAQCEENWGDIVGAGVAQHTRPGKLLGTKLVVYVDTSVWLSELSRNGQRTMLKRLQDKFGPERVSAITLRLDPGV